MCLLAVLEVEKVLSSVHVPLLAVEEGGGPVRTDKHSVFTRLNTVTVPTHDQGLNIRDVDPDPGKLVKILLISLIKILFK